MINKWISSSPLIGIVVILLFCGIFMACGKATLPIYIETPSSNEPAPVKTILTEEFSQCFVLAEENTEIYRMPYPQSSIILILMKGDRVSPEVITENGYFGYVTSIKDPRELFPFTLGIFKYRWIKRNSKLLEAGSCNNLRIIDLSEIQYTCYALAEVRTPIYSEANEKADVLEYLLEGEYLRLHQYGSSWSQVFLDKNNQVNTSIGWVQTKSVNMYGYCPNQGG